MIPPPPWRSSEPLTAEEFAEIRRRAIFECCKWDPQVEDASTLAPFAIELRPSAWRELAALAEGLARETLELEAALVQRPDLHRRLALPRAARHVLRRPDQERPADGVRVMRFDFHCTPDSWRISEANTDVPGGYNEASGFTRLMAQQVGTGAAPGDPAGQLVAAIRRRTRAGGTVALVHATAYADDRQVMVFLARQLERQGLRPLLVSPDHVRWDDGRATIASDWYRGPADFVFRFFPAEWLPNLDNHCGWSHFFSGARTPVCNPATALVTQSKRAPLTWDELGLALPLWRRLLPETRDPRAVPWRDDADWVLKPALGRVGDLVGIVGVTLEREWRDIRRALRWHAGHWVAQRRFEALPLVVGARSRHVCLGVFTVNGRAAGVYGRVAEEPLINHRAQDVAVLIEKPVTAEAESRVPAAYETVRAV